MKYHEIDNKNRINFAPFCKDTTILGEVTIIPTFSPDKFDFAGCMKRAIAVQGTADFFIAEFPEFEETIVYRGTTTEIHCFVGLYKYDGNLWLQNLWTDDKHRNKGYASATIKKAISSKGPLLVDLQLTAASASLIEKMIAAKVISASIVDFAENTVKTYNPLADKNLPMYDVVVAGIARPVLPLADAERRTWLIEHSMPRGSIMQSITIPKCIKIR